MMLRFALPLGIEEENFPMYTNQEFSSKHQYFCKNISDEEIRILSLDAGSSDDIFIHFFLKYEDQPMVFLTSDGFRYFIYSFLNGIHSLLDGKEHSHYSFACEHGIWKCTPVNASEVSVTVDQVWFDLLCREQFLDFEFTQCGFVCGKGIPKAIVPLKQLIQEFYIYAYWLMMIRFQLFYNRFVIEDEISFDDYYDIKTVDNLMVSFERDYISRILPVRKLLKEKGMWKPELEQQPDWYFQIPNVPDPLELVMGFELDA